MGGGVWFWYEIQIFMEYFNQSVIVVDLMFYGINKVIVDNVIMVVEYIQLLIDVINNVFGKVSFLSNFY